MYKANSVKYINKLSWGYESTVCLSFEENAWRVARKMFLVFHGKLLESCKKSLLRVSEKPLRELQETSFGSYDENSLRVFFKIFKNSLKIFKNFLKIFKNFFKVFNKIHYGFKKIH